MSSSRHIWAGLAAGITFIALSFSSGVAQAAGNETPVPPAASIAVATEATAPPTSNTPDDPVVTPDEPVVTPDEPVVTPDEPVVTPDEPPTTDEPVVASSPMHIDLTATGDVPAVMTAVIANTGDTNLIATGAATTDGAGTLSEATCVDATGNNWVQTIDDWYLTLPVGKTWTCAFSYYAAAADAAQPVTVDLDLAVTDLAGNALGGADESSITSVTLVPTQATGASFHLTTSFEDASYPNGGIGMMLLSIVNTGTVSLDDAAYTMLVGSAASVGTYSCEVIPLGQYPYAIDDIADVVLNPGDSAICQMPVVGGDVVGDTTQYTIDLTFAAPAGDFVSPDDTSVVSAGYTNTEPSPSMRVDMWAGENYYPYPDNSIFYAVDVYNTGDVTDTVTVDWTGFDGAGELIAEPTCYVVDPEGNLYNSDIGPLGVPVGYFMECYADYQLAASDMGKTLTASVDVTATTRAGIDIVPSADSVTSYGYKVPANSGVPAATASMHTEMSPQWDETPLGGEAIYLLDITNTGTTTLTDVRVASAVDVGTGLYTICYTSWDESVSSWGDELTPPMSLPVDAEAQCEIHASSNGNPDVGPVNAIGDTMTASAVVMATSKVDGATVDVTPDDTSVTSSSVTLVGTQAGLHAELSVTQNAAVGGTATYSLALTNTGNTLYGVDLASATTGVGPAPQYWVCTFYDPDGNLYDDQGAELETVYLMAGFSADCSADYTVADSVGTTVDLTIDPIATWDSSTQGSGSVGPDDSSVLTASFTVQASVAAMRVTASSLYGPQITVEDWPIFDTIIENIGNVPLSNVTVDQTFTGAGSFDPQWFCGVYDADDNYVADYEDDDVAPITIDTIPVGDYAECDAWYNVSDADENNTVVGSVTVTAEGPDGTPVLPSDDSVLSVSVDVVPPAAALWGLTGFYDLQTGDDLTMESDPVPVGTEVGVWFGVLNSGDFIVDGVTVTDSFQVAGETPDFHCVTEWALGLLDEDANPYDGSVELWPGDDLYCVATYTVVAADVDTIGFSFMVSGVATIDGQDVPVALSDSAYYGPMITSAVIPIAEHATEPTTTPTEPTTTPTEPTTSPTEPTTTPTEPTTTPTEPTTTPTEPTITPTEPTTSPTEPTTSPTEPTTSPTESGSTGPSETVSPTGTESASSTGPAPIIPAGPGANSGGTVAGGSPWGLTPVALLLFGLALFAWYRWASKPVTVQVADSGRHAAHRA